MNRTAAHSISGWRRLLHWVSALLVILALAIGLWMTDTDITDPEVLKQTIWRFSAHKTIGVVILLVTLIRLTSMMVSRGFVHSAHKRHEVIAATAVQAYFLFALVFLPVTGLVMHFFSSGAAPIWILPDSWVPFNFSPNTDLVKLVASAHEFVAKGVLIGVLLHVGGAAKHWIFDADGTIARMVTGFSTKAGNDGRGATEDDVHTGHLLGILLSVVVAAGGAAFHVFGPGHSHDHGSAHGDTSQQAKTVNAQSESNAGTLSMDLGKSLLTISAVQGGDPFTADFSRFNVIVAGNETPNMIKVSIESGSFSSGLDDRDNTVKSADWLDIVAFPDVVYETTSVKAGENNHYTAQGTLTIREVTAGVPLDFTYSPDGDGYRLKGTSSFDRFDLELGRGEFSSESEAGRTIDVVFDIFFVVSLEK